MSSRRRKTPRVSTSTRPIHQLVELPVVLQPPSSVSKTAGCPSGGFGQELAGSSGLSISARTNCSGKVELDAATGLHMVDLPPSTPQAIMIGDPFEKCVRNSSGLALTFICMIAFSCLVQMSEGLHFGVVPYVSRPALGVVSGMVGAGGNLGAVFGSFLIVAPTYPTDEGFINLGIVICCASMIMHFIYFPDEGGILLPPGLPFNPQLVKPKADQKGADQLDFSKVESKTANVSV